MKDNLCRALFLKVLPRKQIRPFIRYTAFFFFPSWAHGYRENRSHFLSTSCQSLTRCSRGRGWSHRRSVSSGPLHAVITQLSATKNVHFWLRVSLEEDTVAIYGHELFSGNKPQHTKCLKALIRMGRITRNYCKTRMPNERWPTPSPSVTTESITFCTTLQWNCIPGTTVLNQI